MSFVEYPSYSKFLIDQSKSKMNVNVMHLYNCSVNKNVFTNALCTILIYFPSTKLRLVISIHLLVLTYFGVSF